MAEAAWAPAQASPISIGAWQVFAAPSNFVVGADGKIHYTLFGGVEWDDDEIVSKLKELSES